MKTDNELIAEFMGWRKATKGYMVPNLYSVASPDFSTGETEFQGYEMEFDLRWDWLMPVVEKIESLGVKFKIDGVRVLVVSKQLQYYWNGGMVSEPKIICVYHGCVQFIKWYNSQAEYKR